MSDETEKSAATTNITIAGTPIGKYVAYALAVVVVGLAWFIVYLLAFDSSKTDSAAVEATPAAAVANESKVETPIASGKVEVYAASAKKKLKLPAKVVNDSKKQVIAANTVEPSDNEQTVTTVIDTDTGKSETYVKAEPLPWLSSSKHGSIGAYYGFKGGDQTARVQATQDLFQVKAVHVGAIVSVDRSASGSDAFVGVGASYKW